METTTAKDTVTLTIDDKTVTVPKGIVVVDAAKTVDIEIPVFCYHEKLGPFGCCRMCLVEVEKMPKLTTACTLQVNEGMVVKTNTPKVEKAQKGVLEFTLLNHPLDCPVCDKGGECPLQDNTFKFGPDTTRMDYNRFNRDKATDLSPVITIDRERCIACQRCTRYSEIIEKDQALVMRHRGFKNRVSTFNDEPYDTRFSGNVIDICPVGALTNTEFRFSARSWDLNNSSTLCGHCACNCNMTLGSRLNEMKRITTRPNDYVDDGWICDKARWGYSFTNSKNRIKSARANSDPISIKDACTQVAQKLKEIVDKHGPDSVGFLGSPYGLNEELYLYQKLFRMQLGTNNIDHKFYADTPGLPVPHLDLTQIEQCNLIILIASDPTEELPILDLRLKKAVTTKGVKLVVLNDQSTLMDKYASLSLKYNVGSGSLVYESLAEAVGGNFSYRDSLLSESGIEPTQIDVLTEKIKTAGKVCFIYNPAALTGNSDKSLKFMLNTMSTLPIEVGAIPAAPATNALGAMDMGVLPDYYPGGISVKDSDAIQKIWGENAPLEPGLSGPKLFQKAEDGQLKALVIFRSNPMIEFPGGSRIKDALQKLEFVVVHDIMETETSQLAHIVIPSNGPGYDEGTTTNIGGRVQLRDKSLNSDFPPDWKMISQMSQELGGETVYKNSAAITKEISEKVPGYEEIVKSNVKNVGKTRDSINYTNGDRPEREDLPKRPAKDMFRLRVASYLFCHDKLLDAESSLAHKFLSSTVFIHPEDAKNLSLQEGDSVSLVSGVQEVGAQVEISDRCNPGALVLPKISDEQGVLSLVDPDRSIQWIRLKKE